MVLRLRRWLDRFGRHVLRYGWTDPSGLAIAPERSRERDSQHDPPPDEILLEAA